MVLAKAQLPIMALTLASGLTSVDPTTLVAEALKNFQEVLSSEQRLQFQGNAVIPDTSSVITFVSRIDINKRQGTRRCVAQRICTFLQAVQGIVDTFVSSNPGIAALAWGGIKTTILIASNSASYFEKISAIIMSAGRSCPTYKQFGLLYPSSNGLQRALCEYFAAVIRLCIRTVQVSQRSNIVQVVRPMVYPFEAEFGTHLIELEQLAKEITLQISYASKEATLEDSCLLKAEREANARHRHSMSRFLRVSRDERAKIEDMRLHAEVRRCKKLKAAIKDHLSTLDQDHTRAWKRAAQQCINGTALWFRDEPDFTYWMNDKKTSVLWCQGNLGTGKTILTSSIITYLHAKRSSQDVISWYFCQAELAASLLARNILGSIARQLLNAYIDRASDGVLEELHAKSRNLDVKGVTKFLHSKIEKGLTYFIILDGLDECEDDELKLISQAIHILCEAPSIILKIFYITRPDIGLGRLQIYQSTYQMSLTTEVVNLDIGCFIQAVLTQKLEDDELKLGDPKLIVRIRSALQEGSQGSFLWAHLLIMEICAQNSDGDIVSALDNLPKGLHEIFSRIMKRVLTKDQAEKAIKLLQISSVAKRVLTTEELREAITIEPYQRLLQSQNLPNDMNVVLRDCCGFVFTDEEEQTVHLIHHSVRQFLFSERTVLDVSTFNQSKLDMNLGLLCMTYLNFDCFHRQLVKVGNTTGSKLDPTEIPKLAFPNDSLRKKVALLLLSGEQQGKSKITYDLNKQLQEASGFNGDSDSEARLRGKQFPFLNYAKAYWIYHLAMLDDTSDKNLWRLFSQCVEGSDTMVERPWKSCEEANGLIEAASKWIWKYNHGALLRCIEASETNVISTDDRNKLLLLFVASGELESVEILLKSKKIQGAVLNVALLSATAQGHIEIVDRLLAAGATSDDFLPLSAYNYSGGAERLQMVANNLNADFGDLSALLIAVKSGHVEIVGKFLAAGADVNATNQYGETALHEAAKAGCIEILDELIMAGAYIDAASKDGKTALYEAARAGHIYMVDVLLKAGANVNFATKNGETALYRAAEAGWTEVVRRLLLTVDIYVDAITDNSNGRTALIAAAAGGYTEVVEILLAAGANASIEYQGPTALEVAAEGGCIKIVSLLLAAGVNPYSTACRKAMMKASQGFHLEVIQLLLSSGGDMSSINIGGRFISKTAKEFGYYDMLALHRAAEDGDIDAVKKLLAIGTFVDANRGGNTPLQIAARGGYSEMVEMLLMAGADVDAGAIYNTQAVSHADDTVDMREKSLAIGDHKPASHRETALVLAVERGHSKVVETLLAFGADINALTKNDESLLAVAAQSGDGMMVELLLAEGIVVTAESMHMAAFGAAVREGQAEILKTLLAEGVNWSTYPMALTVAAMNNHVEVMECLLVAGADVNDYYGRKALQQAAKAGLIEAVERLLVAGADVNNSTGQVALNLALEHGHTKVAERLRAARFR